MVAHHYSSALELARAAGQDLGDLVVRTRAALREAGEHALTLNALAQAEEYFRQALVLTESGDPERPRLLLQYGRVRYLRSSGGRRRAHRGTRIACPRPATATGPPKRP